MPRWIALKETRDREMLVLRVAAGAFYSESFYLPSLTSA